MGAREDCEEALVAHWSQLGRLPGGTLHDGPELVWFETEARRLPFNGVVRTRLPDGAAADAAIARVLERVHARRADVWWAVHPSATPADLGERLAAAGLRPVEQMNFMALELTGWQRPAVSSDVDVVTAADDVARRVYTELTYDYWEVPEDDRAAVSRLHEGIVPSGLPGHRFLAYLDGEPVGKAYLSLAGPPGVAAIYGMSVRPAARGHGAALALTAAMMERARETGCARAVLHATDVAVGVYARAGFRRCGLAQCFATAALWSAEHERRRAAP